MAACCLLDSWNSPAQASRWCAGATAGQGSSAQGMIKEDNALGMLQKTFPKEVRYANKAMNDDR